jgi:hypothetical protein
VTTDDSCGLGDATDLRGMPSVLGPLDGYGGPVETQPPLAGSPAIDRIPADRCTLAPVAPEIEGEQHLAGHVAGTRSLTAVDQRGVVRPQGPGCDAGAVEVTP